MKPPPTLLKKKSDTLYSLNADYNVFFLVCIDHAMLHIVYYPLKKLIEMSARLIYPNYIMAIPPLAIAFALGGVAATADIVITVANHAPLCGQPQQQYVPNNIIGMTRADYVAAMQQPIRPPPVIEPVEKMSLPSKPVEVPQLFMHQRPDLFKPSHKYSFHP